MRPLRGARRKARPELLVEMIRARLFGAHGELCVCDVLKIEIQHWEGGDHPHNWLPVLPGHCPEPCLVAILMAADAVQDDWDVDQ
jgi:hypothetical protein